MEIDIRDLGKVYSSSRGESVVALDGVTTSIAAGDFVSLVGPSGCGKSTMLDIVAGLIPRTTGEVLFNGVAAPNGVTSKGVGLVFQKPVLLPWRTTLENVFLPAQLGEDPVGKERGPELKERALELLDLVGLEQFSEKYPWELSGGMQQRVSLSRALVHDPALLLMDEPFGALDALTRETMGLELQKIWQESGKTVVLITHSISEAVFLGDRVGVMSPRPGRLLDLLKIDLPRPRSLDMMGTEAFGKSLNEVRKIMDRGSSS